MNSKSRTSEKPPCECTQVCKAATEFLAQLQALFLGQPANAKSSGQPTDEVSSNSLLSPLLTVAEGAVVANRTPSALRHMIFQAEAHAQLDDHPETSGFMNCIVRPPGTRRVFLHRERLLALVESWAATQEPIQAKE